MTPTIRDVEDAVCARFRLTRQALKSDSRSKTIVRPRQIAMALAYEMTGKSLPQIAAHFGGRDHTAVLGARKGILKLAVADPKLADDIHACRGAVPAIAEARIKRIRAWSARLIAGEVAWRQGEGA